MNRNSASMLHETIHGANYLTRSPDYYISQLEPELQATFSQEQLQAIEFLLKAAIPKPSPKIVDLRFIVDLVFSRFYVVLFVGKDRRRQPRQHKPNRLARVGNIIAALILLIAANLTISAMIVLIIYLIKSAAGIDLTPGHFADFFKQF